MFGWFNKTVPDNQSSELTENEKEHVATRPKLEDGYRYLEPNEPFKFKDEYQGQAPHWWTIHNGMIGQTPRQTMMFCYHPRRKV